VFTGFGLLNSSIITDHNVVAGQKEFDAASTLSMSIRNKYAVEQRQDDAAQSDHDGCESDFCTSHRTQVAKRRKSWPERGTF
jgi:hypothetical protein